ncbi:mitochondrial inner membrane protein Mitofilin [Dichotomocladium elegans]|nr:mitochondrial inner membrane protein Mitofilin [Dichotomocladium elegans]
MLRVSRLYKANPSGQALVAITKRHATSSATASQQTTKSGSIGRKLVGTTLMLSAGAGGLVYYAMNDKKAHDAFVAHVPEGEKILGFFEDLRTNNDIDNYKNQAAAWKKQVEEYALKAKEYSEQAKDTATGMYTYANEAYQKLTGELETPKLSLEGTSPNEAPKLPLERAPSKKAIIESEHPVKIKAGEATITTDDPASKPVIKVAIEKPEPIVVRRINSDNAVVRELTLVLHELATILNDAGLSSMGRSIISDATDRLEALSKTYKKYMLEQGEVLNELIRLKAKSDKLEAGLSQYRSEAAKVLDSTHAETARRVKETESALLKEFEMNRAEMQKTFSKLLAQELDTQQANLNQERHRALLKQSEELKRDFIRQVKLLVEQERAGRLAKLEAIASRFNAIEKLSFQNSVELDQSRRSHLMHITFGALHDAASGVHKSAFINELEAFRNSAKDSTVIETVLSSIPREVAEEGIESMGDLASRFETVADNVRQVALVPENGGFGAHIVSMIMSKLMFRKEGLVDGADVEAVLARSKYYLKNGDLENAARELNQLSGWPKRLANDWIEAARHHLEVKQALEVAETTTILNSLLEA